MFSVTTTSMGGHVISTVKAAIFFSLWICENAGANYRVTVKQCGRLWPAGVEMTF